MSGTENDKVYYRLLLLWLKVLREEMDRYNKLEEEVREVLDKQ